MGAAFAPAASAAVTSGPDFSCRASAVRVSTSLLGTPLLFSEPIVANDKKSPCDDETRQAASLNVLNLVSTALVNATTDGEPGSGKASASVKKTKITSASGAITADVLTSQASASCSASGAPAFSGGSQIANLKIGSTTIPVSGAPNQTINAGVATIVINEQIISPDGKQVTIRALHVMTSTLLAPLTRIDVVVAESIADASACTPPPPPKQCSDTVDNGDPEDTLIDAADPGCHTDGNPNNPGSYDPNDDNETDLPECSDTGDNSDPEDTLADAADPGCHTDGNPNNPGSYDPNDDDETDLPECSDTGDNSDPEDTLIDSADPGCHTDGDANNPASYDPNDDSEANENQCSDGIDNDGDGNRDFGGFHPDPKCASPDDALETV